MNVAIYNIDRAVVITAHANRPKVSITTPVYSHCERRQAHSNLPLSFPASITPAANIARGQASLTNYLKAITDNFGTLRPCLQI